MYYDKGKAGSVWANSTWRKPRITEDTTDNLSQEDFSIVSIDDPASKRAKSGNRGPPTPDATTAPPSNDEARREANRRFHPAKLQRDMALLDSAKLFDHQSGLNCEDAETEEEKSDNNDEVTSLSIDKAEVPIASIAIPMSDDDRDLPSTCSLVGTGTSSIQSAAHSPEELLHYMSSGIVRELNYHEWREIPTLDLQTSLTWYGNNFNSDFGMHCMNNEMPIYESQFAELPFASWEVSQHGLLDTSDALPFSHRTCDLSFDILAFGGCKGNAQHNTYSEILDQGLPSDQSSFFVDPRFPQALGSSHKEPKSASLERCYKVLPEADTPFQLSFVRFCRTWLMYGCDPV